MFFCFRQKQSIKIQHLNSVHDEFKKIVDVFFFSQKMNTIHNFDENRMNKKYIMKLSQKNKIMNMNS